MKTPKSYVFAVVSLVAFIFVPEIVGQTRASAPDSPKSSLGNERYPLPKEGLVPDKETAIKIAEAVLFPIYGEDSIKGQRPYVVREADYIWWISGTLPKDNFGQVFNIAISKDTAAVLRVTIGEDKIVDKVAGGKLR